MSSRTPFVVAWAGAAPNNSVTQPEGVMVRLVVKTTWSPTAALTVLHQSRSTARTGASTAMFCNIMKYECVANNEIDKNHLAENYYSEVA